MKSSWQLSFLLAGRAAMAQAVIQSSVQHFESRESGPFLPFITFGFGTPAQDISGIFDTGSSDVIVPEAGSPVCELKRQQCTAPAPVVRGQFDPKAASDFKPLDGQSFNATFGGGDQYDGNYMKTTVTLGDNGDGLVPNAQIALATNSKARSRSPQVPVFGLGLQPLEATNKKYDTLPKSTQKAGNITNQAYSFVASPVPFANGSAFFGGIDRSKFKGELMEVPLEKDNSGEFSRFVVKMSSVTMVLGAQGKASGSRQQQRERQRQKRAPWNRVIKPGGTSRTKGLYGRAEGEEGGNSGNEIDLGLDPRDGFTLMDSGGVAIALPPPVLSRMAQALGTTFSQEGLGPVDCDRLSGGAALVMRFNDDAVETRVPLDNMRISEALADPALTKQGLCELGVRPVEQGGTSVATLPFFAAVYTVFDLSNKRLFFAQADGDPGAPGGQLEVFPKASRGKGKGN
ncbi:hypothetical protein LLEC1_03096 [Akanthomyces lecanii]|uniref:Peptidase A1 domain-containing protein n=1 Tax=Cordyceps confragosa TaxID=2714763 RepID=A0A179IIA4_CORDF|nr:hypothetical protein LLEC1_03096 [Akanthomyces lecanii]